jgi:hypothetical protein
MASAIRLADTNWSEHVMRDGHTPGSPYSIDENHILHSSILHLRETTNAFNLIQLSSYKVLFSLR